MIDRHLIGDVAIAVLLAVPTVALSRPQAAPENKPEISSPLVEKEAFAEREDLEKERENFEKARR